MRKRLALRFLPRISFVRSFDFDVSQYSMRAMGAPRACFGAAFSNGGFCKTVRPVSCDRNKPARKIPQLPHKPATGGPKSRLNAKRPYTCRCSLSGDSIKANTRRGVFRVNPVGRRAFPGPDETRPYPGYPGPSLGRTA